jgi:hypothetical protein
MSENINPSVAFGAVGAALAAARLSALSQDVEKDD